MFALAGLATLILAVPVGSNIVTAWQIFKEELSPAKPQPTGTSGVAAALIPSPPADWPPHQHKYSTFVTPENADYVELFTPDPTSVAHPTAILVAGGSLYCLYRGDLYEAPLAGLISGQARLTSRMPAKRRPQGQGRIRELLQLTWDDQGRRLYCIDKSNDVYRFTPDTGVWEFEVPARTAKTMPDPHYVAAAMQGAELHLLDYARNQIWVQPGPRPGEPMPYFAKDVPSWEIKRHRGAQDVTTGVDMVDAGQGELLVLDELGRLRSFRQRMPGPVVEIGEAEDLGHGPTRPSAYTDLDVPAGSPLAYVADADNARVLAVLRRTGRVARQIVVLPPAGARAGVNAIAVTGQKLLVVTGNYLVAYPKEGAFDGQRVTPTACPPVVATLAAAAGLQDARIRGFQLPLKDQLPDNVGVFPGARRIYRHGIHEGVDFFDRYDPRAGRTIRYGTPVQAAAAGRVLKADQAFVEMTPAEHRRILAQCVADYETSRASENRFRGRQVWLQHEGGVVTVYAHLASVAAGLAPGAVVQAGQTIGSVGNSGTSNGVQGSRDYPHLHFEIWMNRFDRPDGEYFGRWLSPWETRRLWEQAFPKAGHNSSGG